MCLLAFNDLLGPFNTELTIGAQPTISESSPSSLGFPTTATTTTIASSFARSLTGFVPTSPGILVGSLTAELASKPLPTSPTFVAQPRPAAAVTAVVVKTPTLHADLPRFHARFAVADATGRAVVDRTGLSVVGLLATVDGRNVSRTCGLPSASEGVGECLWSSPGVEAWFSETQAVPASFTVRVKHRDGVAVCQTVPCQFAACP